jgi:hypothetical protein
VDFLALASSRISNALSGSCLFRIYLLLSEIALSIASSEITTPWKSSYVGFNHIMILFVISIEGSFTTTS